MKQKWDFINVYGAAHEENKLEFLTELARVCSGITIPYMLGSDFNIIRYASEKNKDSGVHRHAGLFNSIISTLDLLDIHMIGEKFTWSNNHSDPTLEILDRVLVNKD